MASAHVMAAQEYILGLDYGEKRVGVAIAHDIARFPRPLTTLANSGNLLDDIAELVLTEGVHTVVVGLPRGMDGGYTQQTRDVESFAQRLANTVKVLVELADETLTSIDAENALAGSAYRKGDIDAGAAAIILQRYFAEHPTGKPA